MSYLTEESVSYCEDSIEWLSYAGFTLYRRRGLNVT